MSTNKYICLAPIETECGGSRIEIGVVGDETGHENDDAIPEAQIKIEDDEEVAPTASVFLAGHVEPEEIREQDEPDVTYTTLYEEYDEEEMIDEVHACRVCLLTDCKLYPLVDLSEENSYTQVTGLSLDEDDGLPRSLCAECYTLLNKCMQFREKSHMGYKCLMQILKIHSEVTVDTIKKVNRNKFKLNSNLTVIKKKPHFDYQFVDESDVVFDENKKKQKLTVDYNTLIDDDHSYAMNEDTKDSTECDTTETTYTEIDGPFKMVKNRKSEHSKDENITFENMVTDNICIDIDEDSKDEPEIFEAEDKLKRGSKRLYLKTKDNNKGKQIIKATLDFEKLIKDHFTTKALSIEEQKETIFRRKSTNNYLKSEYKCDYCFKGFRREVAYNSHMLKHSEKSGKFVCEICQKHCTSKGDLHHHMGQHARIYSCVSCSYTTQLRGAAKLHVEWHKGKKYKCNVCELVFLRHTTLLSHLRIKHPTDHVCHICGYSFLGENGLNAHYNRKHKEDSREVSSDSPRCAECDITFISELALNTHLKVSLRHCATQNLQRNDSLMSERRSRLAAPSSHRREAIADRNKLECEECDLLFLSWRALRVHLGRKHTAAPPVTGAGGAGVGNGKLCDVCGRVFRCEALLRDHALVHLESASYSCAVCGKEFKTRTSMKIHSRRHVESYPCSRCAKTFNSRFNLERHQTYVHSDRKDVKCNFCGKGFKSEEERKIHTDHVHLKKPWPKRNRDRRAKDGQTVARRKTRKGTTDDLCAE